MNNSVMTLTKFGSYGNTPKLGLLRQLSTAYRSYRQFQALPAVRLEDMGLTEANRTQAGFGDFFSRAACS